MEKKFLDFSAEIKAVGEGEGYFEGYASVFGNVDSYRDIVVRGAFQRSLKERGMPVLLLQHDHKMVAGVYTDAREDEKGLYVKGQLNLEVQAAREAYALLKQGAFKGMSIGYGTRRYEDDKENNVRRLTDLELYEVSLVTFPANEQANVVSVKGLPQSERELERVLRDAGFSQKQAKAIVSSGYEGLAKSQRDAGDGELSKDNQQRDAVRLLEIVKNQIKGN